MATYVSLQKFTEKGSKAIKHSLGRATQFRKSAEKCGVEVVGQYWTMGVVDGVLVLKAAHENDILSCLTDRVALGISPQRIARWRRGWDSNEKSKYAPATHSRQVHWHQRTLR